MRKQKIKILKSVIFNSINDRFKEIPEKIDLCQFGDCNDIAIKKCTQVGSKHICLKHCRKICELGKNNHCELLNFIDLIYQFFKDVEKNFNFHEFKSKEFLYKILQFEHKSLLYINLWQFQINPETHDCSMICNYFKNLFKKICSIDIITGCIDNVSNVAELSCEYLVRLKSLSLIEYTIRKYFEEKKISYRNIDLYSVESRILSSFPRLIDCFKCREPIVAILFFFFNIFPISKFSSIFDDTTLLNQIEFRQKMCLIKLKEKECPNFCRDFVYTKFNLDKIKNDLLYFLLELVRECRYDLLNIGVIHVYNEESGYGASFNYKEPLKIETNKGYTKIINPIIKLDKKLIRKKLIPYPSLGFTGKSPQEPFLVIKQFCDKKKITDIILRHYYSGIYIPIDINEFYNKQNLIRDIFKAISFIQENHPKNISQGTAANIIPQKILQESNIFKEFEKMEFKHFKIRDLGGGKGKMTFRILEQIINLFKNKDIGFEKITIIDMDLDIYEKIHKNFNKIFNKELDKKQSKCIEVKENKNFFKEIFKIDEKANLTIISQVLDMYVLISYKYEKREYIFSIRKLFNIIINSLIEEGINSLGKHDVDFFNNIKERFNYKKGDQTYLTDFILSPYFASIWLNNKFYDSDFHPLKTNISYVRSNKFYTEIYTILDKIFELSDYILIIDRGISKSLLEDYFENYEITETNIEIRKPIININVILIKKK